MSETNAFCSSAPQVSFVELCGPLENGGPARPPGNAVILSSIERGTGARPPAAGLAVRYVARGFEDYRVGGRGVHLAEGQIMIASQTEPTEVEIRNRSDRGIRGLCVLLEADDEESPWEFGPLVASAECGSVGGLMERYARMLDVPTAAKRALAGTLIAQLRSEIPSLKMSVLDQASSIEAEKPATRFEMVRLATLAQSILHSTTDRTIALDELAASVGSSKFALLRGFRNCFGNTPAAYHRRLRLELAVESVKCGKATLSTASQAYGFADVSSFSHAYRRTFGYSPIRSKGGGGPSA